MSESLSLIGFRRWVSMDSSPGGLYSTRLCPQRPWPKSGKAVARCLDLGLHQAPCDWCACGIYAWYQLDRRAQGGVAVWGMVVASGRVIEHERGFRAERVQIVALLDPPCPVFLDLAERTRAAADRYGVPVLDEREIAAYGEWWGEVRRLARALRGGEEEWRSAPMTTSHEGDAPDWFRGGEETPDA